MSKIIHRPQLLEKAGFEKTCLLITAPAGYGKTIFAQQYVQWIKSKYPNSFILSRTVASDGNDFKSFIDQLITKELILQKKAFEGLLWSIKTPLQFDMEHFTLSLLNEISLFDEKVMIVVDDFQNVKSNQILSFICSLINQAPPNLILVLVGRVEPSFSLIDFRLQDKIMEIGPKDLSFRKNEIKFYIKENYSLEITDNDVRILEQKTEGWITALTLFFLRLKSIESIGKEIANFSGTNLYITDYILEKVIPDIPENYLSIMSFLSCLPRFNIDLVDSINNQFFKFEINGILFIRFLEDHQYFLRSLDENGEWFRFQSTFNQILNKFSQKNDQQKMEKLLFVFNDLLQITSNSEFLKLDPDLITDVISLGCELNQYDDICLIISKFSEDMIWSGQEELLFSWIKNLPFDFLINNQRIYLYLTFLLLQQGEMESVRLQLNSLDVNQFDTKKDVGIFYIIRAMISMIDGNIEKMKEYAYQALKNFPLNENHWRALALSKLGDALGWSGELSKSETAYLQAISLSINNNLFVAHIGLKLISNLFQQGQMARVLQEAERQISYLTQNHMEDSAYVGSIYAYQAMVFLDRLELQKADSLSQMAVEFCTYERNTILLGISLLVRLEVLRLVSNHDEFKENFSSIIALKNQPGVPRWLKNWISGWEIKKGILLNNPNLEEIENSIDILCSSPVEYLNQNELFALIELIIFEYHPLKKQNKEKLNQIQQLANKILPVLDQYYQKQITDGLFRQSIFVLIYKVIFIKVTDEGKALSLLKVAVDQAKKENILFPFIIFGEVLLPLLESLPKTNFTDDIIKDLQKPKIKSAIQHPKDRLTPRELEILTLISEGFSNAEIAEKLFLSVDTVKGNTRRIYQKLFVNRRTQAVKRAESLGII